MKWKSGPAEYLSEKTFLVISNGPDVLQAKEKQRGSTKATNTGTWPPKMKRVAPLFHDNDRPKTANLEKPNILDPNLIDKLDMSLLSKELLCDSMRQFQLTKGISGGTSSFPSSSKRRQSITVSEHQQLRQASTTTVLSSSDGISIRQKRRSFERIPDSKIGQLEITTDSPRMQKQARITAQDANTNKNKTLDNRKLDDNNNRNGTPGTPKIPALSIVKKKSSRSTVPADFEVFTVSTTRSAPEPCKDCGRPDQPERFHSHPKGTVIKQKDNAGNLKTRNSVPKSIQKPVALNFRSEVKNRKKCEDVDENREAKSKSINPPGQGQEQSNHPSRPLSASIKKGPKTITCYICGREFGSASFPIHEPRCMEKWERENNNLPLNQRRPTPQKPNVAIEHSDWNAAAWEASQAQLVPCSKCGRTFLPDRLPVHQRSCKATPKDAEVGKMENSVTTKHGVNVMKSGPPAIPCKICGRSFGTRSIKIHEPQCVKRWQIGNNDQLSSQQKKDSVFMQKARSTSPIDTQELPASINSSGEVQQKRTITCYICGRDFGSTSIVIHEPQCLKKWHNENEKLPPTQRRKEPQKPEIIYTQDENTGDMVMDLAAMAEASWKTHLSQLVPCKRCGRTFNPDRVEVHERSCKGNR